jgi:gas vesicle protein
MVTNKYVKSAVVFTLCGTFGMGIMGCDAQSGALTGAGVGAGLGALVGYAATGDAEGAVWGAVIGAAIGGTAGYFIGKETEKKKAAEEQRKLAQERGRAQFEQLKQQNPQAAQQLLDQAKKPASTDPNAKDKPFRQAVEVAPNQYVAYDPATDLAGTDVYVVSGQDAANMKKAQQDKQLAQLDGYNMLVQ